MCVCVCGVCVWVWCVCVCVGAGGCAVKVSLLPGPDFFGGEVIIGGSGEGG